MQTNELSTQCQMCALLFKMPINGQENLVCRAGLRFPEEFQTCSQLIIATDPVGDEKNEVV